MSECPRCHQAVDTQALACPYCGATLKAHGHPGIPLYRATGVEPLCLTCTYHEDDSCNFPKRPYARDCTLYSDRTKSIQLAAQPGYSSSFLIKAWFKRHSAFLILVGAVLGCLLLTLLRSK